MDSKELTAQVCLLVEETAAMIRESVLMKKEIEQKGPNNFVTWVDKTSELKLVTGLEKLLPGSGFIAEENTRTNQNAEYTWIVDPLDGTTNFIHGLPVFSISVGLQHNDTMLLGVVYEINSRECFYAWKRGGAYLNGKPIHVSETKTLKDSLMATGFPYYDYGRLDEYIDLFKYMMKHSHGVRRLGSAAVDLAWVACGRFDGFYEYGLHPWDVAAGSLIVEEAGGAAADFQGGQSYLMGKEIIASNSQVFDELIRIVRRFFG